MDRKEFRRRLAARRNNVRFEELERLLRMYGWTFHHTTGSHFMYSRNAETIVLPLRKPSVLRVYVDKVLNATEADDE